MLRRLPLLLVPLALVVPAPHASAIAPPGRTEEMTLRPDGSPARSAPESCSSTLACGASVALSGDGRVVAFATSFTDLVEGDVNGEMDVFVRDRDAGTTTLISRSMGGGSAGGGSAFPAISADGQIVAYLSQATDIVPDIPETTGSVILVHDRRTGQTQIGSIAPDGSLPDSRGVNRPALSDDGRYLFFQSNGFQDDTTNHELLPFGGVHSGLHYRRDLWTGQTEMISIPQGGGRSTSVDLIQTEEEISGDGQVVAFASQRHDLVPGDTNGLPDVFVRDLRTGRTEVVSVATDGSWSNGMSTVPAISADGRYVAFQSTASNLVPNDTNASRFPVLGAVSLSTDVFLRDRVERTTVRVSLTDEGLEPGSAFVEGISDDGRLVLFQSASDGFFPDGPPGNKIYLFDRLRGTAELVTQTETGAASTSTSLVGVAMSGDGATVGYPAPNAHSPFGVGVFVRAVGPREGFGAIVASDTEAGRRVQGWARVDGGVLAAVGSLDIPALRRVEVIWRPEAADLLIRGDVDLPWGSPSAPGGFALAPPRRLAPGVEFVTSIVGSGGERLEIVTGAPDDQGDAGSVMRRCGGACTAGEPLLSGVGTAGSEFRFAVPLAALPDGPLVVRVTVTDPAGAFALGMLGTAPFRVPEAFVRVTSSPDAPVTGVPLGRGFDLAVPDGPAYLHLCEMTCATVAL